MRKTIVLILILLSSAIAIHHPNFITRHNDTLFDSTTIFRFISFNVPNLHLIEDNFTFNDTNNWVLPTSFELHDAFRSVQQAGGTVIRQYCLRIQKSNEPFFLPKHITAYRTYNHESLLVMDTILSLANQYQIRIIIPFLEGPKWWGPKKEFGRLRQHPKSFESDCVKEDYQHLVKTIINRRNTITGVLYKDDPSILCWETGNEMPTSAQWLHEMATYIKSIDTNHLLMDGNYGVRECALNDPNIDIVSNHFYKKPPCIIPHDVHKINGRKAYIIGEWGWSYGRTKDIIKRTLNSSVSGALIWSLRYHFRNGGFLWHKEEGLHWPGGFYRSELENEKNILHTVRQAAYTIRGLTPPPFPAPSPPHLLSISTPPFLQWQSSAGATSYSVERATNLHGPWYTVGDSIDETVTAFRPLFCDSTIQIDSTYYYRVIAHGPGGSSAPSAPSAPQTPKVKTFVDEYLLEDNKFTAKKGISYTSSDPWRYKYDFHRIEGTYRSSFSYHIQGNVIAVRLFSFFNHTPLPFKLYVSKNDTTYTEVPTTTTTYPYCCANPEDHLRLPVLFSSITTPPESPYLKVVFPKGNPHIGRCEIDYY